MIDFLKGFYTGGLKDNPFLTKGILTGVLRLAKENIFTGMNNFDVYSIFSEKYSCYFGFTQDEVNELAEYYGAEQDKKQLKDWYDGYNFGGYELYNPWSVLQYFSQGKKARAYWLQTSGNDIIHSMFRNIDSETLENLRKLYNGQSITVPIHSTVAYSDLDECELTIPNHEIRRVYANEILQYFSLYCSLGIKDYDT